MKNKISRFLRESKQNSLLGQKRRKQLLFGGIALFALLFVFILSVVVNPVAAGAMAIVPLLAGIEKKGEEGLSIGDAEKMLTNMMENVKANVSEETGKQLEEKMSAIKTLIEEKASPALIEQKMQEFQVKLDEFAEKFKPVSTKSFIERFTDELTEKVAELKNGAKEVKYEVKAISSSEIVAPNFNTQVDQNAKMPALRRPTVLDYIRQIPLGKRELVKIHLSATAYCDYAGEGAAVTVSDSVGTATETTFPAQKIKARANGISTEALFEDTPSIVNKILSDIRAQFYIFLENQVLNGLGSVSTTDKIWGIIPQFTTAFNATTIGANLKVQEPNYLDVARAMKLQAFAAPNNREYFPRILVTSPVDYFIMTTAKDAENRPLMLDGMLGGEFIVVQNRALTAGQLLLIDESVFDLYVGRNFEVQIVQDSYPYMVGEVEKIYSDKDRDTWSMIAWFRGMLTMNLADKAGNIYCSNIETAKTALKKAS